jgi:hypothetical protein
MKKIYIVLTHTGTILSSIIKNYTNAEFTHVSISLNKELTKMYSFGRLNPYNPFIGGFVHEGIHHGTFKRFKNTFTAIYSLEILENEYKDLEDIIFSINNRKELYKFNILGLFAAGFNKKIEFKQSFYCAEFIKYLFENVGIYTNLPKVVKPEDFLKINGINLEYKGTLRKYKSNKYIIKEFNKNQEAIS